MKYDKLWWKIEFETWGKTTREQYEFFSELLNRIKDIIEPKTEDEICACMDLKNEIRRRIDKIINLYYGYRN